MARLYPAGETTMIPVQPANGRQFTLMELQTFVGGYIELVTLPTGQMLFVNEDGKRLALPINRVATAILRTANVHPNDVIVGDAVVCDPGEVD